MIREKPTKLYCYVDETGQDTNGKLFIVVAIVVGEERDNLNYHLEKVEKTTGKQRKKWLKSKENYAYIDAALSRHWANSKIFYKLYVDTEDYEYAVIEVVIQAIRAYVGMHDITKFRTTVFIDGFNPKEQLRVATHLRRSGLYIKKVQGIRDESNAIVRLADTVAGLIREGEEGKNIYSNIKKRLEIDGLLNQLR